MAHKSEVVELLHTAYRDELESALNYLANAESLEGVFGEQVGENLLVEAEEEFGHAQMIARRLGVLDSVPQGSQEMDFEQDYLQPEDEQHVDVLSVIEGVIQAETEAIEHYKKLAETAEHAGDRTTRNLAEDLIADEEAHLDLFKSYRREFTERFGE